MAEVADRVVVELIARNQAYDAAVTRSASNFEASAARTNKAANDVERGAARAANATRNLGRQVSDIGVGLAGGQSPFLILAQQAPQVADALADTGGKAAKLAAFFASPWGAALLAAASIAGVLAGKLFETGEAAKAALPDLTRFTNAMAKLAGIDPDVIADRAKLARNQAELRALTPQSRGGFGQKGALTAGGALSTALGVVTGGVALGASVADSEGEKARQKRIADIKEEIAQIQTRLKLDDIAGQRTAAADADRDRARKSRQEGERDAKKAAREREQEAKREAKAWADAEKAVNEYILTLGQSISRDFDRDFKRRSDEGFKSTIEDVNRRREGEQAQSTADFDKQQDTPLNRYRDQLQKDVGDTNAAFETAAVDGLKAFNDQIDNVATKALHLHGIFGTVIADLIRIGSEKLILSLLTGGGSLGLGSLFGRASGGYTPGGRMIRVNEGASPGRVEGFVPTGSGKVIPLGRMGSASMGGGGVTVLQTVQVDARGAVMNDQFATQILARANQDAARISASVGRAAYKGAPQAVSRQDTLGNV